MAGRSRASVAQRFWEKVQVAKGCWRWTGFIQSNGYAKMSVNLKPRYAHRISYELHFGPVPEGLEIDHLCRNRGCVNPGHLEAVSRAENIRRGEMHLVGPRLAAKRTHCKQGHAYDAANAYVPPSGIGRQCRKCKMAYQHGIRRRAAWQG